MMEVLIKPLSHNYMEPVKKTTGAIAYDLPIPTEVRIPTGRCIVPLDFAIQLPEYHEFKIEPRSGFSAKGMEGFVDNNGEKGCKRRFDCDVIQGKVDCDYRGCVGVIVHNRDIPFFLERGTRIAQGTIYKAEPVVMCEVTELDETDRGAGGYGHTGAK